MVKYCQYPGCDKKAVWGVKAPNDRDTYNVCLKHRRPVEQEFTKLGFKPDLILLTA